MLIKKPYVLVFECTFKCTLNCTHCYNVQKSNASYPTQVLNTPKTIDMLKRVVDQIKPRLVIFTGGEVYTRDDLPQLIKAVDNMGVKSIHIVTNGTLLDEEKIKFAKKHHVTLFEMSVLSADKKVHDAVVKSKGFSAFDNVISATQEIVSHGINVSHVFVATKLNVHTLKETLELSYALGVRIFSLNRFNPGGSGKKFIDILQLSPPKLEQALQTAEEFAAKHDDMIVQCPINIPPCIIDLEKFPHLNFTGCGVRLNQKNIIVDAGGNVRMCPFSKTIIGNVFHMPIKNMFKTPEAIKFAEAVPDFCKPCKHVKKCQGCCKASADNCYNNPCREEPFLNAYKTQPIL